MPELLLCVTLVAPHDVSVREGVTVAYACRVRLAVAGPSLALAALFAAGPNAYVAAAPAAQVADAFRPGSAARPADAEPSAGAEGAGLAGTVAGEGRPHPGRDADQEELDRVPRRPSPENPAVSQGAGEAAGRDDPDGPWDPSVPRDPMSPWQSPPQADAPQADGPAAVPRTPLRAPGRGRGRGPRGMPPPLGGPRPTGAASEPAGTGPVAAPHPSIPPYERTAEPPPGRVLRVLPFGTGLALLGAGIGVLAVRLRRR